MPEIVSFIYTPTSLKDLEFKLEQMQFQPLMRGEIDPTIRRICDRAAEDESKLEQLEYGLVTNEKGRTEYCGVSRADLKLVIVAHSFVKKRRDRYQTFPMPSDPEQKSRFVQRLIFEIVEKWSSSDPKTMGASYAQIYIHVGDYANIELDQALELVNQELPKMKYIENSVGDHWRIKPFMLAKSFKGNTMN